MFHVDNRYSIVDIIGSGAYGVVAAAKDTVIGEVVAIKKMQHAFDHLMFTKRTLRELRILRHLRHENIIEVKQIHLPGHEDSFEDVYVICGLMETDLGAIIKSRQPLSDDHYQFFIYQILRGVKYIHSAGVIHRDLKPRNLLVNANCDLQICDFGLARMVFPSSPSSRRHSHTSTRGLPHTRQRLCSSGSLCGDRAEDGGYDGEFPNLMTEYVSTRWYRAPEVLCQWKHYGTAIDVWSIGCIFAELLCGTPLFPGKDTQHQLRLIIGLLGTPTPEAIAKIPNERCRDFIMRLPRSEPYALHELFPEANRQAIDLLGKMLQFDPDKRITVEDALAHPYLAALHCPRDEPTRCAINPFEFDFERRDNSTDSLRKEIWREMLAYRSQLHPTPTPTPTPTHSPTPEPEPDASPSQGGLSDMDESEDDGAIVEDTGHAGFGPTAHKTSLPTPSVNMEVSCAETPTQQPLQTPAAKGPCATMAPSPPSYGHPDVAMGGGESDMVMRRMGAIASHPCAEPLGEVKQVQPTDEDSTIMGDPQSHGARIDFRDSRAHSAQPHKSASLPSLPYPHTQGPPPPYTSGTHHDSSSNGEVFMDIDEDAPACLPSSLPSLPLAGSSSKAHCTLTFSPTGPSFPILTVSHDSTCTSTSTTASSFPPHFSPQQSNCSTSSTRRGADTGDTCSFREFEKFLEHGADPVHMARAMHEVGVAHLAATRPREGTIERDNN